MKILRAVFCRKGNSGKKKPQLFSGCDGRIEANKNMEMAEQQELWGLGRGSWLAAEERGEWKHSPAGRQPAAAVADSQKWQGCFYISPILWYQNFFKHPKSLGHLWGWMGIWHPKAPVQFLALRCLNRKKGQDRNYALEQTGQLMTLAVFILFCVD